MMSETPAIAIEAEINHHTPQALMFSDVSVPVPSVLFVDEIPTTFINCDPMPGGKVMVNSKSGTKRKLELDNDSVDSKAATIPGLTPDTKPSTSTALIIKGRKKARKSKELSKEAAKSLPSAKVKTAANPVDATDPIMDPKSYAPLPYREYVASSAQFKRECLLPVSKLFPHPGEFVVMEWPSQVKGGTPDQWVGRVLGYEASSRRATIQYSDKSVEERVDFANRKWKRAEPQELPASLLAANDSVCLPFLKDPNAVYNMKDEVLFEAPNEGGLLRPAVILAGTVSEGMTKEDWYLVEYKDVDEEVTTWWTRPDGLRLGLAATHEFIRLSNARPPSLASAEKRKRSTKTTPVVKSKRKSLLITVADDTAATESECTTPPEDPVVIEHVSSAATTPAWPAALPDPVEGDVMEMLTACKAALEEYRASAIDKTSLTATVANQLNVCLTKFAAYNK